MRKCLFICLLIFSLLFISACRLKSYYLISFNSNGGSYVSEIKQLYDKPVQKPSDPIRDGYTFIGWYVDPELTEPYHFEKTPNKDMVLYAKWILGNQVGLFIKEKENNTCSVNHFYHGTEHVVIPKYYTTCLVTSIDNGVFHDKNIKSIYIPNSIEFIGESAFMDTEKLTTVTFEENSKLTQISDFLFSSAKQLNTIILPDHITTIGYYAFHKTENLEHITIPNDVTRIESCAFNQTGLKSITIPKKVHFIGDNAFGFSNITEVIFEEGSQLSSISDSTFAMTKLNKITLPPGVISIGNNAFAGSTISEIIIPNSVTDIKNNAFYNTDITKITIPMNVTHIGNGTFFDTYINEITILNPIPPTIDSIFNQFPTNFVIYVPESSVELYKTMNGWSSYADYIQAIK